MVKLENEKIYLLSFLVGEKSKVKNGSAKLCSFLRKRLLSLLIAVFCLTRVECFPEGEGEYEA